LMAMTRWRTSVVNSVILVMGDGFMPAGVQSQSPK
jgi:hypothetical protein